MVPKILTIITTDISIHIISIAMSTYVSIFTTPIMNIITIYLITYIHQNILYNRLEYNTITTTCNITIINNRIIIFLIATINMGITRISSPWSTTKNNNYHHHIGHFIHNHNLTVIIIKVKILAMTIIFAVVEHQIHEEFLLNIHNRCYDHKHDHKEQINSQNLHQHNPFSR